MFGVKPRLKNPPQGCCRECRTTVSFCQSLQILGGGHDQPEPRLNSAATPMGEGGRRPQGPRPLQPPGDRRPVRGSHPRSGSVRSVPFRLCITCRFRSTGKAGSLDPAFSFRGASRNWSADADLRRYGWLRPEFVERKTMHYLRPSLAVPVFSCVWLYNPLRAA